MWKEQLKKLLPNPLVNGLLSGENQFSVGLFVFGGSVYYLWEDILNKSLTDPQMALLVASGCVVVRPVITGCKKLHKALINGVKQNGES